MLSKPLPDRVDPHALARENICLEGAIALSKLNRLAQCLSHTDGEVQVSLTFHLGKKERVVIFGALNAVVSMECQYCLEPVELEIQADVELVIGDTDDQVRELSSDADAILLTGRNVPLASIIEDDLILGLPMVARHDSGDCLEKLGYHVPEQVPEQGRENSPENSPEPGDDFEDGRPFSELSSLKEAFRQREKKP
jgi:uncharacterized protein